MKKQILCLVGVIIFSFSKISFGDNLENLNFSNTKYSTYSDSISSESRYFLLQNTSCVDTIKDIKDIGVKKETLINKILFLSLFGNNIEKILEEDKEASEVITNNNFTRSNLSFKYFKIISGKDLTKKNDSDLYQEYIIWLTKMYGNNLTIEGNFYKNLIGKNKTLEMYIDNIFISNKFDTKNTVDNLKYVCNRLEFNNKSFYEKILYYILDFYNKNKLYTSLGVGLILILIGVIFLKVKKRKIKKINFFKVISAEKK